MLRSLLVLSAALIGAPLAAQSPVNNFELTGTFADADGTGALVGNGGSFAGSGVTAGLAFGAGQGPDLPATVFAPVGAYSLETYFSFENVGGYRRIIDFLGGTSDSGLYVLNGGLNFFGSADGPDNIIAANTLLHVVFTRAADGASVAYLNGASQLSFTNAAVTTGANGFRFFRDDAAIGGEQSAGFVDFIRTYDAALTADQVAALYNNGTPQRFNVPVDPGAVPEPATWAMLALGFGLVGAAVRRRRTVATA